MAGMSGDGASTTHMFAAVSQTAQQHGTSDLRLYRPILRLYFAYICLFCLCSAYVLPICRLYPSIGAYAACVLTHFASLQLLCGGSDGLIARTMLWAWYSHWPLSFFLVWGVTATTSLVKPVKGRVAESFSSQRWRTTKLLSRLSNVYRSRSNVFPYYDISLAAQAEHFEPEYEFTGKYKPDSSHRYWYYFSGDAMDERFKDLRQDLNLSAVVRDIIKDDRILAKLTANFWIGDGGVVASAHYDSVYNVYLQYEGSKTFTLLPPSSVHMLQVHGRMHPYACQSRFANLTMGQRFQRNSYCITGPCVDNTTTGMCANPLDEPIAPYRQHLLQYTLHPGDLLLIPPYWFHEVQTHSDALAISLWWDAAELDVMDEVYAMPLPFETEWEESVLLGATGEFVSQMVSATVSTVRDKLQHSPMDGAGTAGKYCTTSDAFLNFDVDSLRRLLEMRYADDVKYSTYAANLGSEQGGELEPAVRNTLRDAAVVRAVLFSEGFLSDSVYARREVFNLREEIVTSSTDEDAGGRDTHNVPAAASKAHSASECGAPSEQDRACFVLENQLAVLSIKLCDYVEDVFRHVSEMVSAKASQRFMKPDGGSRTLNAVAVQLLLDWLRGTS
jgi:hypothetical protein